LTIGANIHAFDFASSILLLPGEQEEDVGVFEGCGTEQVDPEVATTGTPNAPSARNNTTNIPAHMILEWINRIIVSQDGVFNAAL